MNPIAEKNRFYLISRSGDNACEKSRQLLMSALSTVFKNFEVQ